MILSPFVVGTVVCLGALLLAEHREAAVMKAISKTLASLGFLGAALAQGALSTSPGAVLFAGLVLSLFGDVFLLGRSNKAFLAGLGAFLLAHVAFAISFGMRPMGSAGLVAAALPLLGLWAFIRSWLMPHVKGGMRGPVVLYILAITLMVVLSAGAYAGGASLWLLVGAVMFMVSDLAVARDRFIAPGIGNRLWGLPLYYGAQLVLAWASGPG
jgi:uncharacterized membrane protein YhhN